jgi:hypothetical protein
MKAIISCLIVIIIKIVCSLNSCEGACICDTNPNVMRVFCAKLYSSSIVDFSEFIYLNIKEVVLSGSSVITDIDFLIKFKNLNFLIVHYTTILNCDLVLNILDKFANISDMVDIFSLTIYRFKY